MKNFFQFIIPILVIFVIGGIMLFSKRPVDGTKKLYIECNSISENYEIHSSQQFVFASKNDLCKLDIYISNVDSDFVKINTSYLWRLDDSGKIDKKEPKANNFIEINKKTTLYSYDEKTKYIFEYK